MGQSKWAWGCAVLLVLAFGGRVAAEQEANPFAADAGTPTVQPESKAKPDRSVDRTLSPDGARQRIEAVLNQGLKQPLDFIEQPLSDVVTILSETYEIPIQFDTKALDAVAASPDVEVSIQISNVTLRSALELMLKNLGAEALTYIIDNEVLLITTQEEAETRLEVIVYRIDDLVGPDASRSELDRLVEIVIASVEHESWMKNGTGEGEINSLAPAMLVVSQTHRVHEQLQRLLDNLRRTKAAIEADRSAESEAASHRPVTRAIRVRDASNSTPENRTVLENVLRQSVQWQTEGEEISRDDVFLHVLSDRVLVRHVPAVIRQVELAIREISPSVPQTSGGGRGGDGGGRGGF